MTPDEISELIAQRQAAVKALDDIEQRLRENGIRWVDEHAGTHWFRDGGIPLKDTKYAEA